MPLVESGNDRLGKDYSKTAYGLFPRYRLDEAIEIEVERITGQPFRSLAGNSGGEELARDWVLRQF
jgi:hypothetical protein